MKIDIHSSQTRKSRPVQEQRLWQDACGTVYILHKDWHDYWYMVSFENPVTCVGRHSEHMTAEAATENFTPFYGTVTLQETEP